MIRYDQLCRFGISLQYIPLKHQPFRQFHATKPNNLISEALQLSHEVFQGLHTSSGLPWHISIPLTAVLFRVAWLPIQYLTGRNQHREQRYAPLLVAWRKVYQKQAIGIFPRNDESAAKEAERWVRGRLQVKDQELRRKYKTMKARTPIYLQLSFFPVWILNMDVIRRMSGDGRTILGIINRTENKSDTGIIPMEPEFLTDQFLWLPNLVSADPFWILPCVFGILQVTSVWMIMGKSVIERRTRLASAAEGTVRVRERVQLSLSEIFLALAIISPAILIRSETSAAIVLYLIGSVSSQLLQKPLLRTVLGWEKGIKPAVPRLTKLKAEHAEKEIPPKSENHQTSKMKF